jgi:hypothetical protein
MRGTLAEGTSFAKGPVALGSVGDFVGTLNDTNGANPTVPESQLIQKTSKSIVVIKLLKALSIAS